MIISLIVGFSYRILIVLDFLIFGFQSVYRGVHIKMDNRSIKHPREIFEDFLVKVDKFIIPANFIVLDMEEDEEIPIILG